MRTILNIVICLSCYLLGVASAHMSSFDGFSTLTMLALVLTVFLVLMNRDAFTKLNKKGTVEVAESES